MEFRARCFTASPWKNRCTPYLSAKCPNGMSRRSGRTAVQAISPITRSNSRPYCIGRMMRKRCEHTIQFPKEGPKKAIHAERIKSRNYRIVSEARGVSTPCAPFRLRGTYRITSNYLSIYNFNAGMKNRPFSSRQ